MRKIFKLLVILLFVFACEKEDVNTLEKQYTKSKNDANAASGPKNVVFYSSSSDELVLATDWSKTPVVLKSSVISTPTYYMYNSDRTKFAVYYNGYLYVYDLQNGTLLGSSYFGNTELYFDFESNGDTLIVGGSFSGLYRYNFQTNSRNTVRYYSGSYRTSERVTGLVIDENENLFLTIQYYSGGFNYYRFIKANLSTESYSTLDSDYFYGSYYTWRIAISTSDDVLRVFEGYNDTYSYYKYPIGFSSNYISGFKLYLYDIYLSGGDMYYDNQSGIEIFYSKYNSSITKIFL